MSSSRFIRTLILASALLVSPLSKAAKTIDACPDGNGNLRSLDVSWTVSELKLVDTTVPNPLTGGSDMVREVKFDVGTTSSTTSTTTIGKIKGAAEKKTYICVSSLSKPYNAQNPAPDQWDLWTFDCVNKGTGDAVKDLSFEFVSDWAQGKDDRHPATLALRQEFTCGESSVEVNGSSRLSLACDIPYSPYGCGPCFTHQCNGTTVEIRPRPST